MALSTITRGTTAVNGIAIYTQVANHVDVNTENLLVTSLTATDATIQTISSTSITTQDITIDDNFIWEVKTDWVPVFNAGTSTNVNAIAFLNPRYRLAGNRIYCELEGSIQGVSTATIVANFSVPNQTGSFISNEQAHGNGSKYNISTGNNQVATIFSIIGTQEVSMMVTSGTITNDSFYVSFWFEVV